MSDPHEQSLRINRPWWDSSSLKALDLDQLHKEGLEKGDVSVVLPHLCNSQSSLTRSIHSSPDMGVEFVCESSIVVDTTKGQQIVTTSVVKLDDEAKEIQIGIEKVLSENFGIDTRKYNIPVRLTGEPAILQIALEQKSRRNAHLISTPVRSISVRKETKLLAFQGRLLHNTMQKTPWTDSKCFARLEFDYKKKPGSSVDEFPTSCARSRTTVHRFAQHPPFAPTSSPCPF
jgi:hypothetical protein